MRIESTHSRQLSRRDFLQVTALGATSVVAGCAIPGLTDPTALGSARLLARVGTPTTAGPKGLRALGLGDSVADGVVYVPASYAPGAPAPFVLLLHGAGGTGADFITRRIPEADATGQILLAPDSRRATWDAMNTGHFGPDIVFLDSALRDTFAKYTIDPRRVAVAGFSDGATISLALGLANGDLFARLAAWSPGGLISKQRVGKPAVFISHGVVDPVLPIGATSRVIVPELRDAGYQVEYREFASEHIVPDDVLHDSMVWMAT